MTLRMRMESAQKRAPQAARLALALVLALTSALWTRPAAAEPSWFAGKISDAPNLATQTKRWIVFYFQTEKAVNCVRMSQMTWPMMEADDADENFVWVKLDPEKNAAQFKYYEVMVTPEIVLVDPKGRERARLRGYVDAQTLLKLLNDVYAAEKSNNSDTPPEPIVMTPDGKYMKKTDYEKLLGGSEAEMEKYFFYDGFDKTPDLGMVDPQRYMPVVKTSIRIDPSDGRFSSPALYIGADVKGGMNIPIKPSAQMVIDLSRGSNGKSLSTTDLDQGRMRVKFAARVKYMPPERTNCMELKIVGLNEDWRAPSKKSYMMNLNVRETQFREKFLVTDVFNVKQSKVYLILWVDYPAFGFWLDELRVELLPPTDDVNVAGAGGGERNPAGALEEIMKEGDKDKGDFWFRAFDKNKDSRLQSGEVTKEELASLEHILQRSFTQADVNKDGYLDLAEWQAARKGK